MLNERIPRPHGQQTLKLKNAKASTDGRGDNGRAGEAQASPRRSEGQEQHQLHRRFGDLEVAVVTAPDEAGKELVREVGRTRARVRHIWPAPELVPSAYDLIFCDLLEDLPRRLPWLPGEPETALVLIVDSQKPIDLDLLHNCAPHAVIYRPATAAAVLSSLLVGRSHFLYERRLRGRIAKLDDNLRTMRSVERAKAILMRTRKVSEEEAYHYLRCQAMERRVTIGALANAIVDSQDLLGKTV